jgi:hypothetical protein
MVVGRRPRGIITSSRCETLCLHTGLVGLPAPSAILRRMAIAARLSWSRISRSPRGSGESSAASSTRTCRAEKTLKSLTLGLPHRRLSTREGRRLRRKARIEHEPRGTSTRDEHEERARARGTSTSTRNEHEHEERARARGTRDEGRRSAGMEDRRVEYGRRPSRVEQEYRRVLRHRALARRVRSEPSLLGARSARG